MGIIQSVIKVFERQRKTKEGTISQPSSWVVDFFRGGKATPSGVDVTEENSLQVSTVYACVDILSNTVASLPLFVYKRKTGRGRDKASDHYIYRLLHDTPNQYMNSFDFRKLRMAHKVLWGNSYAEIEFDRSNRPVALWPIPPWRCQPELEQGKLVYVVKNDGLEVRLEPFQVLHGKGLSLDGFRGLSRIAMARNSIGLTMAAEEFGARFFGEGANVGGVVMHPGELSDKGFAHLKESLNDKYAGLGKAHRLMLLEEGLKYEKVGIPPEDAQFLQTRQYQIADHARIFNVPLHLLQSHEKSTSWGSGLEELTTGFLVYSIRPYLISDEQEYNRKLFKSNDYYVEHVVEGLLRGDSKSRAEYYGKMFQIGVYSQNDIREKENENPIPGGDRYYVPVNMVPIDSVDEAQNDRALRMEQRSQQYASKFPIEKRAKVVRAIRSAQGRFNLAGRFERVFRDASGRIIRREEADIMRQARKIFKEGSELEAFRQYLAEFYESHYDYLERQMKPVFLSLAESVKKEAAGEVNGESEFTEADQEFLKEYLRAFYYRHTDSSQGQLNAVARTAIEENEDAIEKLQTRFDEWRERRPGKMALEETVKLSNAIAETTFITSGIREKAWFAVGASPCEFCEELDGTVVAIERFFLGRNDRLSAEDREPMNISKPCGHGPLHNACVCQILPI